MPIIFEDLGELPKSKNTCSVYHAYVCICRCIFKKKSSYKHEISIVCKSLRPPIKNIRGQSSFPCGFI